MATGVGAIMWFWLLYRAREDGAVVLVRFLIVVWATAWVIGHAL
jgi:hypothetical protein